MISRIASRSASRLVVVLIVITGCFCAAAGTASAQSLTDEWPTVTYFPTAQYDATNGYFAQFTTTVTMTKATDQVLHPNVYAYHCDVNGGPWIDCTQTFIYTHLLAGTTYTFGVYAEVDMDSPLKFQCGVEIEDSWGLCPIVRTRFDTQVTTFNVTAPGVAATGKQACHRVKVKRHGKVVRTKHGKIKYKLVCK